MTQTTDLAQALDQERRRQGLSLTEVITRTGVSRAAVYRLFKGGDVQLTTLLAVSNLLGLSLLPVRSDLGQFLAGDVNTRTTPRTIAGTAALTTTQTATQPSTLPTGRTPAWPPLTAGEPLATTPAGPVSALSQRAGVLQQRLAATGAGPTTGMPRRSRKGGP